MYDNYVGGEIGKQRFRGSTLLSKVIARILSEWAFMPCFYAKMSKPWGKQANNFYFGSIKFKPTVTCWEFIMCSAVSWALWGKELRALDPVLKFFVRLYKSFGFLIPLCKNKDIKLTCSFIFFDIGFELTLLFPLPCSHS